MLPTAPLAFALLFSALSVSAMNNILIGYRRVGPGQPEEYQKAGGILKFDKNRANTQTGPGVYMLQNYDGWMEAAADCAFFVEQDVWSKVNKAFLPQTYTPSGQSCPTPLWWPSSFSNVPGYLQSLNPAFTIDNTVLFSWIDGKDTKQILIPPNLLNEGALKGQVKIQCASLNGDQAALNAVHDYGEVDWEAFDPAGDIGPKSMGE